MDYEPGVHIMGNHDGFDCVGDIKNSFSLVHCTGRGKGIIHNSAKVLTMVYDCIVYIIKH